jgi:Ca2+/Na+ antiporter
MKNNLIRSVVFILLGTMFFSVSTFTNTGSIEKWSSFAFGLSFPIFVLGIAQLSKQLKPQLQRIKK